MEERELTWKIWKMVENCVWKPMTRVVGCFVEKAKEVVASFGDCWRNIKDAILNGFEKFASLLPQGCNSWRSCKTKLLNAGQKLVDLLLQEIKKQAKNIVAKIGPGFRLVGNFISKAKEVAVDLGKIAGDAAKGVLEFMTGSATAIWNYQLPSLCTPSGIGYWKLVPTDCGSFDAMGKIFSEIWAVWKIKDNFDTTVQKFRTCLNKKSFMGLPSPFIEVSLQSLCLPQFMKRPLEMIVGSFHHFIQQIREASGGCSGSDQAICQLAADMKSIGLKIKDVLDTRVSLLQAAKTVGRELKGQGMAGTAETELEEGLFEYSSGDCKGPDFSVSLGLNLGISFNQPGGGTLNLGLSFTGRGGCKNAKGFFDLLLGFGASRSLLGSVKKPEVTPSISIGFSIGTAQTDVASWDMGLSISGSVPLVPMLPANAGSGMSYSMKPPGSLPSGFGIGFSAAPPDPSLAQAGAGHLHPVQEAVTGAMTAAESYEEQVLAAVAAASSGFNHMDVDHAVDTLGVHPHDALRHGASALKNYDTVAALVQQRAEEVHAGSSLSSEELKGDINADIYVSLSLCLTCSIWENGEDPREATFGAGAGQNIAAQARANSPMLEANWYSAMRREGWSRANGILTGFHQGWCNSLACLQKAQYAEYDKATMDCYNADWGTSFNSKGWSTCRHGYFMTGLYRSSCSGLKCLDQVECCRPADASHDWKQCVDEDWGLNRFFAFTRMMGWKKCTPGKGLVGLYRKSSNKWSSVVSAKCCYLPA